MRLSPRLAVLIGIVFMVAAVVLLIKPMFGGAGEPSPRPQSTPVPSASIVVPSQAVSVEASREADRKSLYVQVKAFETAYRGIRFDDTLGSRQKRLEGVSTASFRKNYVHAPSDSAADTAFRNSKGVIEVEVAVDTINGEVLEDDGSVVEVTVSVTTTSKSTVDGTASLPVTTTDTSVWVKEAGVWKVNSIEQP